MSTALDDDELLVETRLPLPAADTRFGFSEFSRRAGDFALAMALVAFRLRDGVINDARLGIGGAEDRPRRIPEAEVALEGEPPGADAFEAAAAAAAAALDPMEDAGTSAQYRRELAQCLARRALESAAS
jgi:carbon-monoxide dehydrogenase medium subunit